MKLNFQVTSVVVLLAGLTFSCGGGDKSAETSTEATASADAAPVEVSLEDKYKDDPVYIKGLEKVKGSDCTGCHQVERKLIGPSYADVAAKYENTEENVAMLAQKAKHLLPAHVQAVGHHRNITAGRGRHREKFVRYEDVPREIEPKIIAEYGRKVEVE